MCRLSMCCLELFSPILLYHKWHSCGNGFPQFSAL
ncbi:hypothetical protein BVRB_2g025290 [Beta vulgaris subsp. vulgaris]|nr:hypothetical protein BVRB_2g025290 [Beta vulgaris subsp. vulgaris]